MCERKRDRGRENISCCLTDLFGGVIYNGKKEKENDGERSSEDGVKSEKHAHGLNLAL